MSRAAEQAYERIREAILGGRFFPAGRLKEEELVVFCGVSRTPVREALRRLAAEDYVVVTRNQGAQVKAWSDEDMEELFDLRALLEGHAAGRAAPRIAPHQLELLRKGIAEMDAVLASSASAPRKTERFVELNRQLHESVWTAAGSERLHSLLSRLVKQAPVVRTARRYTLERIAQSHNHHRELVGALSAQDAVWAKAVMRSHIRAGLAFLREHAQTP